MEQIEPFLIELGEGNIGIHGGDSCVVIEGESVRALNFSRKGVGIVGEPTTHENGTELEKADWIGSIAFRNIGSVDVVIAELQLLRGRMVSDHLSEALNELH